MTASLDSNQLASYLVNTQVYGVTVRPDTPPEFWVTYEIQGDQGSLFMAAVIGEEGEAGADQFPLLLQKDPYTTPAELPQTLQNNAADKGKFWVLDTVDSDGDIVGSQMWVWYGTAWRQLVLGTPGPPGKTPIITPSVELIDADAEPDVATDGSPEFPSMVIKVPAVPGEQGPAASLASCPDVDMVTNIPVAGDVLGFTGRYTTGDSPTPIWVPVSISQLIPSPYSMPENAFTSFSGISQRAGIGSFAIPPQPFPWTPIVWGHIGAFGLELSANPLMIGCEVLLGDPRTGQLVGRGLGNTLGEVNIMPHYSTPGDPGVAITPDNGTAVVPANHSNPADGTIYVNLYNDGEIGLYQFSPHDAQLFVLVMPITDPVPLLESEAIRTVRKRR
ncbi:hypothetical protein [Mycolicibacterium sphagni]|uniref:hypothetical protein n=1 Tax=Mycolicibacterium sphagni TaxID=1786 RepID=UPI0021F36980|nr:hypothetical protein [Mycolicibacterium sphagni]MCV7174944.1 hypothetical protein [Mycolicibacterium sphagni]